MMRVGLLLFAVFLGVVTYRVIADYQHSPSEIGQAAKDQMAPGMKWTEIIDVAEPGHWQAMVKRTEIIDGEEYITYEPGAEMRFEYDLFESTFKSGMCEGGFYWLYNYGHQVNFSVYFDESGHVVDIADRRTMADLLQTRR